MRRGGAGKCGMAGQGKAPHNSIPALCLKVQLRWKAKVPRGRGLLATPGKAERRRLQLLEHI